MAGTKIYDKIFVKTPGVNEKYNVSHLTSGVYIVQMISRNSINKRRFVVKQTVACLSWVYLIKQASISNLY